MISYEKYSMREKESYMSESSLKYDVGDKLSMIEYVNGEYEKWQEIYEIPFKDEFNVRLLLQVRWDILHTQPEHTKTKLDLIRMAEDLRRSMRLEKKPQPIHKIMYVDILRTEGDKPIRMVIYYDDKMTILQYKDFKIDDYANMIQGMLNENEIATVYIDANGIGMYIYDCLLGCKNIDVQKLKIMPNINL